LVEKIVSTRFPAFHTLEFAMDANTTIGGGDMRKVVLRLASIAALAAAVASTGGRVEAMPIAAPNAMHAKGLGLSQPAQFVHLGRPYCWYRYGWAGAGWYWCGYGTLAGVGWGGAYGWNGWVVPRSYRAAGFAPGYRLKRYR
jgi:hypothetical protein